MSTSILYHGWGVRGYVCERGAFVEGGLVFHVRQKTRLRCPVCRSAQVIGRGTVERRFKTVPIGLKPVTLVLPVQRVECHVCQAVRQVAVQFADARRTYTKAFERYAVDLCRVATILDAARHLGVSWDTVKEIEKRYLKRAFGAPPLRDLRAIAIDELYLGRTGKFLTIVLDLEGGAIVHVGEGKGDEALQPFWKKLRRAGAAIEAVAMDMSPAYAAAVAEHRDPVADRERVDRLFARVRLQALLDEEVDALSTVAVVPNPQRNCLLPDVSFTLWLDVNIDVEFNQRREALLRFVKTKGNHVRRDDEVLRVGVLSTPS